MIDLARERGVANDQVLRQSLARYYIMTEVHRYTQHRAQIAAKQGTPGPEGSISKLALGHICRFSRELSFAILGPATMLNGSDAPYGGELQLVGLSSPGVSIGAGTLPNTPGNLGGWIINSQALKPGNRMPPMELPAQDLQALIAYLESLK